jgi:predicted O-linked N-acetylglucosamine transferase (SPINDLY family)
MAGGDAAAYGNLGLALRQAGQSDEAIAALERAVALDPGLVQAHSNLGEALRDSGRLDEAGAVLERAIALGAEDAATDNNLGNVLKDQGNIDGALNRFRKAVALKPGFASAASNLLFTLHSHPEHDAHALLAEHRQWARQFAEPLARTIRPHENDGTADRRLRLGYVSPDFRAHAVGQMLKAFLPHQNRGHFEIACYSDVRMPDAVTAQLKGSANRWCDIAGQSDAQVAERIHADQVDILVDLALHTAGNRMLVFARKPAPVQVTMLGLPSTTGLATMDYRLTDPYLDPPGTNDADYTENSIRLPHCFWLFAPPDEAIEVSAVPALTRGFVTFGCLNQFAKLTPPALELWVKILQAVPDSRLVLQAVPGLHRDAVRARFARGGIIADRLEFTTRAGRLDYHRLFHNLDLALDPFPYNGHTSTLDALWMGVPVITLAGRTAVGRGGVSILSNVGLRELIARSAEEYAGIAISLARDLTRVAELRAHLRAMMQASPLVDARQYAADVEAAFRTMWQTWCSSCRT